jgi:dCMP deaminase
MKESYYIQLQVMSFSFATKFTLGVVIMNGVKKRENYLSWDEYFMSIALLSSMRSKDPNTQVGACIVDKDNKIIGTGYNGLPNGCSDDDFPWGNTGSYLDTKYPFTCHAELNAILNSIGKNMTETRIYVSLFPCNECAKAIIQSGIDEVIYLSDKYADKDFIKASKILFDRAKVKTRQIETKKDKIDILLK